MHRMPVAVQTVEAAATHSRAATLPPKSELYPQSWAAPGRQAVCDTLVRAGRTTDRSGQYGTRTDIQTTVHLAPSLHLVIHDQERRKVLRHVGDLPREKKCHHASHPRARRPRLLAPNLQCFNLAVHTGKVAGRCTCTVCTQQDDRCVYGDLCLWV